MLNSDFQKIINSSLHRYKILKETKQYEDAMKELEKIISLMSQAIATIFDKSKPSLPQYVKPKLLQGIRNVTLEEVLNPNNTITIDKDGMLKIKKT